MAAHTDPGDAAVYNFGTNQTLAVDDSVALTADRLGATPVVEHTGGKRGWPGDAPFILLDCARLHALGWSPTLPVDQAVFRTVDWLEANA